MGLICVVSSAGAAERPRPAEAGQQLSDRWLDEVRPALPLPGATPHWRRNLFRRVGEDQAYLLTRWWPAELRRSAFVFPALGSIVGATGSAVSGPDLRLARSIESWTTGSRRDVAEAFTRLGDADSAVVLIGGGYLISRWAKAERMSRATSLSAEALINGAIYTSLLKRLSRRTRPAGDNIGRFFVHDPGPGQEPSSFPSGHATGAFAIATVFAAEYRHRRWVAWVAYGTAGCVAGSRVALGRHFPTDVIAGALLGRSLARMVLERSGDSERPHGQGRFEPLIEPRNGGLGLVYRRSW